MKLFIDSGNLKEIEALVPLGIIDGITTNPSLLAKEPGDYREILKKICRSSRDRRAREVVATDYEGMMREGRDLASIDPHIVVKVPFTTRRRAACKTLSSEGKRVNVTLCFSPTQALIAAKVGRDLTSARSSAGSTTSRPPAWSLIERDRRDLRQLRVHDRSARRRRPAARCTSSKRRAWAPTSAPARRRSSSSCSSIR